MKKGEGMKRGKGIKKIWAFLVGISLLVALGACTPQAAAPASGTAEVATAPVAEKVSFDVPAFALAVNDKTVTKESMSSYPLYQVTSVSTNSAGTESTAVYIGYTVNDILASVGIGSDYKKITFTATDGYASDINVAIVSEPTTLVAIALDGKALSLPTFAPCTSRSSGDFIKRLATISVDGATTVAVTPDTSGPTPGKPEKKEVTEKVTFADYSFVVNGKKISNADLAGLPIYKITASVETKDGATSTSVYCGYVLTDLFKALGITTYTTVTATASDGYEVSIEGEVVTNEYTLLAIERDGEVGEGGTIFLAPCESTLTKTYAKLVTGLTVS